ncbi:MAG: class I tRNA ligase family protein [Planctomycetaceae bacterium]
MSSDLPKQYEPKPAQEKWFAFWESRGYFNADPQPPVADGGKPPHTIMIPLPNVTGALHMGHALNGTCQDLITRWRRMQGYEALWMPGTDHAGIATQAVVERRMLEEEKLTRHDIGREALVERIWKWKAAYEKRIIGQLKQIGASCDWRRTRFTLDEVCSRAVRRTFFKMFKDGLIYRGKRLVNWDTFLQTAVADDEVFEEEIDGHFWTFRYPVVDGSGKDTGEFIRFSTTRPETMLGDTAVCVNPTDERYTHLVGKQVRIPLNGRLIPIIADSLLADKELGTGAVKVTPGHDPNDYACYARKLGQPDEIAIIDLLNLDGTVAAVADNPKYVGIDRLKVRGIVVEDMTAMGFFEGVEDRKIPLKHSDRSKTPIEPLRSDQWFVKMDDHADGRPGLAQMALDAVETNRVRFYPSRYAKTYLDWLGEKRDWCISRQLWWGHRIPVWSRAFQSDYNKRHSGPGVNPSERDRFDIDPYLKDEFQGKIVYQEESDAPSGTTIQYACLIDDASELQAILESAGFTQDPDVLDTWFSSALWPHATLGWPDMEHNPPLDPQEVAKQNEASSESGLKAMLEQAGYSPIDLELEDALTKVFGVEQTVSALKATHLRRVNEQIDSRCGSRGWCCC